MTRIDWPTLVNWIVSGAIGVVFGAVSGWITYRYRLRQSEIAWKREREYQERQRVRDELTQGLDDPSEAIKNLKKWNRQLYGNINQVGTERGIIMELRPFSIDERYVHIQEAKELTLQIDELLDRIKAIIERENKLHSVELIETRITEKIEQVGFENLTREQKNLLCVSSFRYEINQGGLHQYFSSTSGNFAQDIEGALAEIGAPYMVPLVKEAMSVFSNGTAPRDHRQRLDELEKIEQQDEKRLEEIDNKLCEYDDELMNLLIKYAEQHKDQFNSQENSNRPLKPLNKSIKLTGYRRD